MFREIYFWMYHYLCKIKTNKTPAFNSLLIICVFQGFNLGTCVIVINYLLGFGHFNFDPNLVGLSSCIVLSLINYFVLFRHKDFIFDKYSKLNAKRKHKGQIYFWIYISLSILLFFISVANLAPQNS